MGQNRRNGHGDGAPAARWRRVGRPGAPRYAGAILGATIVGSSMAFLDGTVVGVALPVLQVDLNTTIGVTQWVVEAYQLLLAALILVGGTMGDLYGRRRIFAIGLAVFVLGASLAGLSPTIGALLGARVVQGLGGALLVPGSLAIITATFSGTERGRAIGLWASLTSAALAIGPVIGGWLVETFGWRAAFLLELPLGLTALALTLWRVPETSVAGAIRRLDLVGALLQVVGLGALVYGLIEAGARGFGDSAVIASLALGVAALALFFVRQARARNPMMPLSLFRSSDFAGANLLTLLLYAGLYGALFFLPFNLIQVQGYTATAAGAAQVPFVALLSLLSPWAGTFAARRGPRLSLIVGPLAAAAGMALLAVPSVGGSYWTTFFLPTAILGVGMGITVAPLTSTVMGAAPAERTGTASGINNAVSRVAGLLAVAVLGVVAVAAYGGALSAALEGSGVPAEYTQAVLAQRMRLAATEIPAGVPAEYATILREAVNRSFVAAFRSVSLICAALAAGAGVVTAAMIGGGRREI